MSEVHFVIMIPALQVLNVSLLSEYVTKSDTFRWISHFLVTYSFFFDKLNKSDAFKSDRFVKSDTFQKKVMTHSAFWDIIFEKNCQETKCESVTFSECVTVKVKKWNSCFLRFFKFAKNEIHVFWGFLSLQKVKFMFFEVF